MFPPTAPTATFPYRILRKVGEGAMGEVYQAEDRDLGRQVAIKVIRADHTAAMRGTTASETVQRFLQEARAAAALSHPGVTTVHRVGTEAGRPYIAMEWLEGRTLEAALDQSGPIPVQHAAAIGLQVLSALAAAHAAGIVHRDIKPGNLMLLRDGRIKVTDFGIARVRGSNLAHTQEGTVVGTPAYAAPEQLAGGAIDCRADLYAVAGVLYEAVVGEPPFPATSLYELIHAIQRRAPVRPSALVAGIPHGFDDVVLKGLAREPADRFSSAAEMSAALAPLRVGVVARPRPGAAVPAVASTLAAVPTVVCAGERAHELVLGVVQRWPATALPRQDRARLLQRLLDRPLHAPAFTGALTAAGVCVLIDDGLIYRAFDPETGRTGDDLLEALPDVVEGVLHASPFEPGARVVPLLASLLLPPLPRLTGLSSSFADLPGLATNLATEGFEGALRFARGASTGVALFSRGQRVLDVFGAGWPTTGRWEEWIARTGALASVEPMQTAFPAFTFRQQLAELPLEVVRPAASLTSSVRTDTVAAARTVELRPTEEARDLLRRGESMVRILVTSDPAYAVARWVIAELGGQFTQHGRAGHWKGLVEPLDRVRAVRLHHALPQAGGDKVTFDAVAFGPDGNVAHVLDRVARGSRAAIEAFVARATAAKQTRGPAADLGAAILVAPSFDDDALAAYLATVRTSGTLRSGLDALSHREGFVRLGLRRGFHLLLVEESAIGQRRPLVVQ